MIREYFDPHRESTATLAAFLARARAMTQPISSYVERIDTPGGYWASEVEELGKLAKKL